MDNKKLKGLTFSYDDGVTQDVRLIELFNKYGMKATFNLNSELLGKKGLLVREGHAVFHDKIKPEDLKHIYEGHEVASHTLTHPFLPNATDDEIIRQVECDRQRLSDLCGYEVVGFAYPGGGVNYNSHVAEVIKTNTGVGYCRTTMSSHNFDLQNNLYEFMPSAYHHNNWEEMFKLGEEFLKLKPKTPKIFYIWGHSYEFDIHNTWGKFEEFLQMMSGKEDICYATNKELLL